MIIVPNGFLQHAWIFLIISCIDLYNDVFIVAIITFNNSLNLIYGHLLLTSLFRPRLLWYCWKLYSLRPKCRRWFVFFFYLLPLLVLTYQPNNYSLWYKMQMTNLGIFSSVQIFFLWLVSKMCHKHFFFFLFLVFFFLSFF